MRKMTTRPERLKTSLIRADKLLRPVTAWSHYGMTLTHHLCESRKGSRKWSQFGTMRRKSLYHNASVGFDPPTSTKLTYYNAISYKTSGGHHIPYHCLCKSIFPNKTEYGDTILVAIRPQRLAYYLSIQAKEMKSCCVMLFSPRFICFVVQANFPGHRKSALNCRQGLTCLTMVEIRSSESVSHLIARGRDDNVYPEPIAPEIIRTHRRTSLYNSSVATGCGNNAGGSRFLAP